MDTYIGSGNILLLRLVLFGIIICTDNLMESHMVYQFKDTIPLTGMYGIKHFTRFGSQTHPLPIPHQNWRLAVCPSPSPGTSDFLFPILCCPAYKNPSSKSGPTSLIVRDNVSLLVLTDPVYLPAPPEAPDLPPYSSLPMVSH